ncbi:peptidoglycan DD-metalloendopeptidase family protein [Bizionia sediminis]|uniref:Peptidoglycan DD-metalloendopeptidase family protein n=1 Tax=Bizionia sediminis TaxID=1737064 RepID=A0ABW5KSX4_9FLAO
MRKFIYIVFFLCPLIQAFGQIIATNGVSSNLRKFVASSYDLLETYEAEAPAPLTETADITTNYWDTNKLTIAYETDLKFPIHLQFNDSSYVSPIAKNKVITSRYGWRKGRAHKGIDIDLETGDSLFAMFDGIIRFAKYSSGHGHTVVVRHFNGLETVYAHLSRYGVKINDTVKAGDYLGKGGASGNARGSHLHLEVSYQGIQINPEYLLQFNDSNKIRAKELWITKDMTRPELFNSKRKPDVAVVTSEADALKQASKPKTIYVVKRGDTLSRISAKTNMSISALCKLNNIQKNAILKIGQRLQVI